MNRRRVLAGAGALIALTLVVPPWQTASDWGGGGYEDAGFKGWHSLLLRPDTSVPILHFEIREGRMPVSALDDPETVERFSSGFVAIPDAVAWGVLLTEWMVVGVCAAGLWFAFPGSGEQRQ